jgi:tetratricopeptide (TPR) repeat protein
VANIQRLLGHLPGAEKAARQVLALRDGLTQNYPGCDAYRRDLAGAWHNLGVMLEEMGQAPEAEQAQRQALALWRQSAAATPDSEAAHNLGKTLQALSTLRRPHDLEEARSLGAEADERQREAVRGDPSEPRFRRTLALQYQILTTTLRRLKQAGEAGKCMDEALRIGEQLAAEFP